MSPLMMMTPPRTPELKQSRSSTDLIENNILYRNNYLTVPAHKINNIAKGDSFYSLSDFDQVRIFLLFILFYYQYFLISNNHLLTFIILYKTVNKLASIFTFLLTSIKLYFYQKKVVYIILKLSRFVHLYTTLNTIFFVPFSHVFFFSH